MEQDMPVLYILMRTDLESMNPGKAIAQGSHAANMAVGYVRKWNNSLQMKLLAEWEASTDDLFGTVLVLDGGTMDNINDLISEISVKDGAFDTVSGIVFDPTYPIRDGKACHHIPLTTCAWVFTRVGSTAQKILSKLDLHP
jgi:hypothetical protein